MAYVPTEWKDEVPESTPLLYTIKTAGGAIIEDDVIIELKTPVTAGTPLNAANLNHIEQGIVDLEASTPPGVFQAKGDLFAGAGSKTGVRLPIGANGQVLTADSGQSAGVKWAPYIVYGRWTTANYQNGNVIPGTGFMYMGEFGLSASVKAVYVSVEATPDNANGLIRIKKQSQAGIGAVILRAQTAGRPVAAAGWVEVGAGGFLDFMVSGANWTAVYAEIFAYHL